MVQFVSIGRAIAARRNGISYDARANALFDYLAGLGLPFDAGQKSIANNLVAALDAANVLTATDALYFFSIAKQFDQSLPNWAAPGTHDLTVHGAPTFTGEEGWEGNGTDGYLDTGLTVAESSFMSTTSFSATWVVLDDVQRSVDIGASSSSALSVCGRNGSDAFSGRFQSTSYKSLSNGSGAGIFSFVKGAENYDFYKDGALLGSIAHSNASSNLSSAFQILKASGAYASGFRIAYCRFGGYLDQAAIVAEHNAVRNATIAVDDTLLAWSAMPPAYFIQTLAAGADNGLSWSNATTIGNLEQILSVAEPGVQIYIRADDGAYAIDSNLNSILLHGGGTEANPITIAGVDVDFNPMNATFQGTRDEAQEGVYLYRGNFETSGYDVFTLASGVHDIVVKNLEMLDVGCCFVPQGDIARVTLSDIEVDNSYSFLSNESNNLGQGIDADVYLTDQLSVQRCNSHGFSYGFLRIGQRARELLVEDCFADSEEQKDTAFCICFHQSGTTVLSDRAAWLADNPAGGAIYRRSTAKNASYHSTASNYPDGVYWNSDGFCDERVVDGSLYEDSYASGNTDGGWDCKSKNLTIRNCISEGNKVNFKVWNTPTLLDGCTSREPVKKGGTGATAHISFFGGSNITCTCNDMVIDSGAGSSTVLVLQSSATGDSVINFNNHDFSLLSPQATVIGSAPSGGSITANFDPAYP